jgi:hypothetical protein
LVSQKLYFCNVLVRSRMLHDGNYQCFVGFEYIVAERFVHFPVSPSAEYQCDIFATTHNHLVQNPYVLTIHSVS